MKYELGRGECREEIDFLIKPGERVREEWERIVIVGMGGPANVNRAFFEFFGEERVFILDNPWKENIERAKEFMDQETLLYVVSKSGNTAETLYMFSVLRERAKNIVFCTGGGYLKEYAERKGIKVIPFPKEVEGRYSAFTPALLFPAAALGYDVEAFLKGGERGMKRRGDAGGYASLLLSAPVHVISVYHQSLLGARELLRQLIAESTGKEGKGVVPVSFTGTKDQHSQLQYYLDGKPNISTIFLTKEWKNMEEGEVWGKRISGNDLLSAAEESTYQVLKERRKVGRVWIGEGEEEIGELIGFLYLSIVCAGKKLGVNPYNQPAVVEQKRRMEVVLDGRV